ncbi:DNA-binding response regulator [Desulfosporosinus sp. PR]|uniref:DNA-binding response regulator n=1 Tax=Candidatus Desulfosporosinus nitrosoreducens TaxID=3401928 RepID=UPI0027E9910B|nr:DNA-binding response regulator [Desulfosporosinus sp. PR]MDQ7094144.1 DNA-binding response regulator [Desulfosporosinus sp. PR]
MILTISLFLLGVVCLFLGWRWQNPPSEEVLTALKGISYLKKELQRVQDQIDVHVLEEKFQRTKMMETRESESKNIGPQASERNEDEQKEKGKLYSLTVKEPGRKHKAELQRHSNLSPKYQEVLSLAANGQGIPEIAQRLLLSQDAVRMVLKTQTQGGAQ